MNWKIRLFSTGLSIIPRTLQIFLGNLLGDLARFLIKKRALITQHNIQECFPQSDHKLITKLCFRHFGNNLLEMFLLPFHESRFGKHLCFENPEMISKQLEQSGVVMLTAHFGNWEILSCLCQKKLPIFGIYQKLKHHDQDILALRQSTGVTLLEKKSSVKHGIKALREKKVLGLLGDQGDGIEVPFFGKPTRFPEGPVRLALQTNSNILLTFCLRDKNKLVVKVFEEIPIMEGESKDETIYNTMAFYARRLEEFVRQHPEQYFWMHDIWRNFKK